MGRGATAAKTRPVRAAAQQSQNSQSQKSAKPKSAKTTDKTNSKKIVTPVVPPAESVEVNDSDTQVDESGQTPKTV